LCEGTSFIEFLEFKADGLRLSLLCVEKDASDDGVGPDGQIMKGWILACWERRCRRCTLSFCLALPRSSRRGPAHLCEGGGERAACGAAAADDDILIVACVLHGLYRVEDGLVMFWMDLRAQGKTKLW